jgi:hypothetical protein
MRKTIRYRIRKHKLKTQIFFVQLLVWMNLIPKVWYKCEIEYAEMMGKEMADWFNGVE